MTRRRITISILGAVIAVLIAWDVYVAVVEKDKPPGTGATISEVTLGFAQKHPVLPFALGVVAGHLLWSQVRKPGKTS
jgi:zinc transporter ZupT